MEQIYFRVRNVSAALASLLIVCTVATPAAGETITLSWNENPELSVIGYMLHVGTQSGSYTQHIDVGMSTTYGWPGATPGQRYCFAVSAYVAGHLEGPKSNEVCGYSNGSPVLVNPGNRSSALGQQTTLQLQGSDPDGQPVSYGATGLPPGLALMASTGYISGTPSTAGTYPVTARVSDGVLSASQTFTWTITSQTAPDTALPTVSITGPTTSDSYVTSSPVLDISGTAGGNAAIVQVIWTNDRGESGTVTGTSSWTASVPLEMGWNDITVTATDAAGNIASAVLTVKRLPPTVVDP